MFLLFFLIIGAVGAASDSDGMTSVSDLTDGTITQASINEDAVENNVDNNTEIEITKENKFESENEYWLKLGADAFDNSVEGSGTATVNNWAELKGSINDGAVIELAGDDVYYAEGSGININSGTVTIDGKGHVIDAEGLHSRIFEINDGATLILKNLVLKNAKSNQDGGAIYNSGTLTVTNCTFADNSATTERGGAIYNYEGALKITYSRFEKNVKYNKAIYNYGTEDNPFRLTIINTTMIEDKVAVNYEGNERILEDKRDIDFLTTGVNAYIPEVTYGTPVLINVDGIDADFTGMVTVNITNTIYNTYVEVANGEGNTTLDLDINRYTARFKNFISLTEDAFERDDTKPYLEINFKVITNNSFSALEDMISKATDNVTLNQDYIYDSKTDSAYIRLVDKTLAIYGNGHSIDGGANNGDTLFLIEDDSNVIMENVTLENGHAQSRSHLGSQVRMGGAIYVSRSTLTIINSTLKNNKAEGGDGGAIYSDFSTLNILESNFTDNNAANGKCLYIQGGNGVYILNSIINQEDIYNEPDWDNSDRLARITIFNDFNATLNIPTHNEGNDTLLNVTQPKNFTGIANLTINNNQICNIQITNGQVSVALNLDPGQYTATMTTPDTVYYNDSSRNITCTYLAANTTSNEFIVKRVVDVGVNAPDITYGETETINVNINATGNITIRLNGENITCYSNIAYDKTDYLIGYLTAGNYTVEVIYYGNDLTAPNSNSANFIVYKANPQMKVIANNITYNETESITVNVNASGNVTIKVNNCEETIVLKEGGGNHLVLGAMVDEIEKFKGMSIVDIPGLNAGNYTIEVTYNGNDNYNSSTEVTEFTVFKASSALAADDLSIFYSSAVKLVATLKDGRGNPIPDAEVNVAVGDIAETLLSNENGEVYLDIGSLAPGNHTANFTFTGNENYRESNTVANVIVNAKIDTAIFVVYDSDAKKLVATLTNAEGKALVTANVVVSIDGVNYALKTNSKGQAKVSTVNLTAGSHIASASYKGNAKYNPSNASVSIYVKGDTSVSVVYDGDAKQLVATLTNAEGKALVTANLVVSLNGENQTLRTNSKGQVKLSTENVTPGIYTASVSYKGNNKYNPSSASVVVNTKLSPCISLAYDDGAKELIATLTNAEGKALVTANLVVSIDGVDYALKTNSKGQVKVSTANLTYGTYAVSVSYKGNSKYNPSNASMVIKVKLDSCVSLDYDADANELVGSLTNGEGKALVTANVIVTIDGVDYALKTNSRGQVKVSTENLTYGIYQASISYKGNGKYNPSNASIVVNTKLNSCVSLVYDADANELVGTLTNAEGKALVTANVIVNLNGVDYALKTNSRGQVKVSTENLTIGSYDASISYKGNSKYNAAGASIIVNIKLDTCVSLDYDADAKELIATLTNAEGNAISGVNLVANINGVDYSLLLTNSDGQAKFSTRYFVPGNYTTTIYYEGNSEYNLASKTKTIIVQ